MQASPSAPGARSSPRLAIVTAAAALALTLLATAAPPAHATGEEAQTRAAIDGFVRAAQALEAGDRGSALTILDGMAASVTTLRQSAERFKVRAGEVEAACRQRSVAIVDEIGRTYQQQRDKEAEQQELQGQIRNLDAQLQELNNRSIALSNQRAVFLEEATFRQKCAADGWFYFTTGRCWQLGFQDLFENRVNRINNDARELSRQQQDARETRARLDGARAQRVSDAEAARQRAAQLESDRRRLETLDAAARGAAVNLSDIVVFWSGAENTIRLRFAEGVDLLRELLPALDKTADAQAFDAADRRDIRTLRDSMLAFSRSVDAGNNFLQSDHVCR